MSGTVVDLFLVYQFIKRLTTPFVTTKAYTLGLIDKNGKTLRSAKTAEEKDAFGYYDRIIFNLKRLIEKIPGGKTRIATYAAAILLLREERGDNILDNRLLENVLREHIHMLPDISMNSILEAISEDGAPANSAGGGHVAGIGVGPKGEPGVSRAAMIRRRSPVYFAGNRVFEVDNTTFHKNGPNVKKPHVRYSKYIDEDNYGEEVREYARMNPHSAVLVRNETTGEMRFLRYGKKSQMFGEEVEMVYYKATGKYVPKARSPSQAGGPSSDADESSIRETLGKYQGKWALLSKKTGKPLAYYKGEGKPSADWVSRQERRVQFFKRNG